MAAPADQLTVESDGAHKGFQVVLDNFEGPFDLLLQLISRHKLDVTEIALSKVTDEFIAHVKAGGAVWDLEQTSSFLVVAATLLDLKAARLLPQGEVEDPEDLALLEARDLLFARLLQYRAFKIVSGEFAARLEAETLRFARPGGLEPRFAGLLPEVTIPAGPERLAQLAARALTPSRPPEVSLEHLHGSTVSVQEQAGLIVDRLQRTGTITFRALTGDADKLTTVARFLALLELFRNRAVSFEQLTPLGELTIRWTGDEDTEVTISDEFDGGEGDRSEEQQTGEQQTGEQQTGGEPPDEEPAPATDDETSEDA
ncbi:segregation and condensation protein A [Luteococcus peritonei]|uniref:Segregation and condensation protein A n=1 Tax=Luteococcus peritonei TaxID=88874 RepID=A0ABW4RTX7_9ACTN